MTRILVAGILAGMVGGCDGYDCSKKSCANGTEYQSCLSCYETECSYQTRDKDDEVIEECSYSSNGTGTNSERDACFNKAQSAACNR